MKKRYRREAYLLDDGILLHGWKDKRGFHPDTELQCGFDTQIVTKKDINKQFFFSFKDAKEKLGSIRLSGGKVFIGIDDGMAMTKMYASIGNYGWPYVTNTILSKENTSELIKECLEKVNIELLGKTDVEYCLSSENNIFMLAIPKHIKNVDQKTHVLDEGWGTTELKK